MVTSLKLASHMATSLGLSDQTVIQHVKNLQREGLLTSTGRGRGAAHMKPSDVAKLLIAVVGSDLVKDSVATLRAFGPLVPLSRRPEPHPRIILEDHLAALLTSMAGNKDIDIRREDDDLVSRVSLVLMSVGGVKSAQYPRVAIARRIRHGRGVSALSFASAGWTEPEISVAEYAAQHAGAGFIIQRHVTYTAMESIAWSI